MSVVVWLNKPSSVEPVFPSSLQLVPVTRIEKRSSNEPRRQLGLEMTNRIGLSSRENQNFPTTGRPPDRDWMDDGKELLRKLVAILTLVVPTPVRAPEPSAMDKF